jgi:hypothetical protein
MISAETMAELEARRLLYILGVRERTDKLVRESHRGAQPHEFVARDHRRSRLPHRDRDEQDGKRFVVRSAPRPAASLALQATGVALPPTVRHVNAD